MRSRAALMGEVWRYRSLSISDIDLFVVRPDSVEADDRRWRERIERLPGDLLAWTGNHANIVEVPEPALVDLRRRRPPVVDSLEADGLTLSGPDVAALLEAEG